MTMKNTSRLSGSVFVMQGVLILLCLWGLLLSPEAGEAQENPDASPVSAATELESRTDLLVEQRRAKMDSLCPPDVTSLERALLFVETSEIVEKLRNGYYRFFLRFGGLSTRAKFALGFRYQHEELIPKSNLSWAATFSFNGYRQFEIGMNSFPFPSLPLRIGLSSRYRNFPQEEFFGFGYDSDQGNRSNFRLRDFLVNGGIRATFLSGLGIGVRTGYLHSRTGPGTNDDVPSLETVFPTEDAPGFGEPLDHWLVGFTAEYDTRDSFGNPRSGILFLLNHTLYNDRDGSSHDFELTTAEFQGYLPFFRKHRVIAFRLQASTSAGRDGGTPPFFMLPYVGGSESLRAYREYRFRDRKSLLANLEYRFEAFIGLDAAIFGDVGQVREHWDGFRLSEFKWSYGGGLRFNTASSVFLRTDVAKGTEGTRFYLKFENVF